MDKIWNDLYQAAKAVQNDRDISAHVSAGCVAAAIESASGKIYTGVCIDTASTLGICAERNALFHMITGEENAINGGRWGLPRIYGTVNGNGRRLQGGANHA